MAYLVLAVVVLLVIGCIVVAVLARHHWRWFHVTTVCTLATLAAIFLFPTAGALRSRAAWHKLYEDLQTRTTTLQSEQRELKFGDASSGTLGVLELNQLLDKVALEAGRNWNGLVPAGIANNQITLNLPPQDEGVAGLDTPPADDAGDGPAVEPAPLAEVGTIVYGFAELPDQTSGQRLPSVYLGEYQVTASTPNSVTITPVSPLRPEVMQNVNNAPRWTLYELLPLDSHTTFLAPGSQPTDDNVLGRIDEEAVRRFLGNRVTPQTLQSYLEDGRRSQPDDPILSRWVKVEFTKNFEIDVDDKELTAPISSGGYFDGIGRALDARLKRGAEGVVKFKPGDQILLKEEAAADLLDNETVKLIDRFYLRPLNDYRFILRRIQLEVTELQARIEELRFEAKVLNEANDKTAGLIVIQQTRKDQLEKDLAQFRVERESIESYSGEVKQQLQAMRTEMATLHANNLELEEKLEAYHQSLVKKAETLTAF